MSTENKKTSLKINGFLLSERASGIEPPSRPWQGRIIATIPRPQILALLKLVISC